MDWSCSTVTSSVRDLASVGQEPLLAHVVVERRQSALSRHPNSSAKRSTWIISCRRKTVKSYRKELWFETPGHRAFLNITPQVEAALKESGVREGLALVNAMHITASVFINDDERKGSPRMNPFRVTVITELARTTLMPT
jgi:Uncharacterised protein family UPF0047